MTMLPTATALYSPNQILSDPALSSRTPGEEFAWSVGQEDDGQDVTVPIHAHLTGAFPLFASRPRYTVRHLLKIASVTDRTLSYVYEAPNGRGTSGNTYQETPESGFTAKVEAAELTALELDVELPPGLLGQPALLSAFVDYRVLVRLGVVENQSLLHGTPDGRIKGLLNLPGIRRQKWEGDLGAALTAAAGEVEETGGSCDGITVHPSMYWQLVRDGMLSRLGEAGIRVARTRMMPRDQALLGDYRAAVTLLDPHEALLALRRKAGPNGGDLIQARSRLGLAVHLPQHFLLLSDN
jgi:hypothetical protein